MASVGAAGGLKWTQETRFRHAPLEVAEHGEPGFTYMKPGVTGISFVNQLARERYTTNQIYLNGSGVAAGDYDGDGRCDLFFCGLDSDNKLYRNLGDWRFEDVSAKARIRGRGIASTGCAFADLNGNGRLDLVLNSVGQGTWVLLNDGKGTFRAIRPLNPRRGGMSLALGDVDGDGDLDLYVTNYRTFTIRDQPDIKLKGRNINGKPEVYRVNGKSLEEARSVGRFTLRENGKILENGQADAFYLNDGQGRFLPVPFVTGKFTDEDDKPLVSPPYDWGLSVMMRDINGDTHPDLYVCNDFKSPDRVWINRGDGTFRAIGRLALRKTSEFSMGVDFADLNRDGQDDFIVVDMLSRHHKLRQTQLSNRSPPTLHVGVYHDRPQYSHNMVYLGRGGGAFTDISFFSGLEATEWSWSPVFLDVDLDGFEDFIVTTGHPLDMQDMDVTQHGEDLKRRRKIPSRELLEMRFLFKPLKIPNLAFRNNGDLTFSEHSAAWGIMGDSISNGMAMADLDNDGDMDLAINNFHQVASLYRNNAVTSRVAVRLRGREPNTRGIGARIEVEGSPVPQSQEMICGGRYLSSDQSLRVFAAGKSMTLRVKWRSGEVSVVNGVQPNRIYEISEPTGKSNTDLSSVPEPKPFFGDASSLIGHMHHENVFNDFARQRLLPRRLSQTGPSVAWFDFDGDGWEDLMISTGGGGQAAFFRNTGHGGFEKAEPFGVLKPSPRDQSSLTGFLNGSGSVVLMVDSNLEDALAFGPALRQLSSGVKPVELVPAGGSAYGPIAMTDYDADGDVDIFLGGRGRPGLYPDPADSLLLKNSGGKWIPDLENNKRLKRVGLVNGAVWSDLSGDGFPELVLACEWGPLRVFENRAGQLVEETDKLGLGHWTGWWNSVTAGDFNGDGRMDLVAGNWGRNTRYQSFGASNLRFYASDLSGAGGIELLEAYHDTVLNKTVPILSLGSLLQVMPFLRDMLPTWTQFAEASTAEVLGIQAGKAAELSIATLDSMVFINTGDGFDSASLPWQAQLSPVFGVVAGDFDGDGMEDLILAQNFFANRPDIPRMDAGQGLWLRGNGQGGFLAVDELESGISVHGEQRGSAAADFDQDGRLDLVIGQNATETRLFRNLRARPGLRVRVKGGSSNPGGIGARVQLIGSDDSGPCREIRCGEGYSSQNGFVQVMSLPKGAIPESVRVTWPGGGVTERELPPNAYEVEVSAEAVRVVR